MRTRRGRPWQARDQEEVALRTYDVSHQYVLIAERREMIRRRLHGGLLQELTRAKVDAEADVEELGAQLAAVDELIANGREVER